MDLYQILNVIKTLESVDFPFSGETVGQRAGDQVHGTEKAKAKKSGEHPFKGRLVGASESAKDYGDPIASDLGQQDLLFKTAIKAVFDAAREDVNIDFEDAIRMVSKLYNIPYAPSDIPGLQQKLNQVNAEILAYKKARANQRQREQDKLTHQTTPDEERRAQQWMKTYGAALTRNMRLRTGVKEESQQDRNARIIAGEYEDAMAKQDHETAKKKMVELLRLGYQVDKTGKLQAMGMYEEWEQFINEYGMTTGGTANPDAQKQAAQQTAKISQGVNKLKSAGVNIPSGTQAVQSLSKDPTKDPVSQLDRNIDAGLGQEVQDIVTKGSPSDVNQLAALIRRVKQQPATGKE